jgi:hypothetical protein
MLLNQRKTPAKQNAIFMDLCKFAHMFNPAQSEKLSNPLVGAALPV